MVDPAAPDPSYPVRATAADLDGWLWHRPAVGEVGRSGDEDAVGAFASIVSSPID